MNLELPEGEEFTKNCGNCGETIRIISTGVQIGHCPYCSVTLQEHLYTISEADHFLERDFKTWKNSFKEIDRLSFLSSLKRAYDSISLIERMYPEKKLLNSEGNEKKGVVKIFYELDSKYEAKNLAAIQCSPSSCRTLKHTSGYAVVTSNFFNKIFKRKRG